MTSHQRFARLAAALAVLSIFAGCGEKPQAGGSAGCRHAAARSGVVTVTPQRLTISNELPGRLEATRVAQVRARAAGIVQQARIPRGQRSQGRRRAVPHRPGPVSGHLRSAQAALAKAEANLAQASLKLQRYKPLVETNAISKQEYDDASSRAEAGRRRCRVGQGRAHHRQPESRLCHASPRRFPAASAARW